MCETKNRLNGKTVVVTGGSSGVGFEVAKELAYKGAKVIIASRNKTKLINARDNIIEGTGNKNVDYKILDLGSLRSVREFTNEINMEERLDVLINNAGAVGLPDKLTEDGINLTMQVNFLGSFLLTYLLLPLLKRSAPSRIINGSASSMYIGEIDFDHWNDVGRYNLISALANSKLAQTLFTAELSRRLNDTGVTANTFDPYLVRDTDIFDNMPEYIKHISRFFVNFIGVNKEDVGKQIAYLAAESNLERVSGKHFKFCMEWMNHWLVSDEKVTKELWERSKELVKLTKDEDWDASTTIH